MANVSTLHKLFMIKKRYSPWPNNSCHQDVHFVCRCFSSEPIHKKWVNQNRVSITTDHDHLLWDYPISHCQCSTWKYPEVNKQKTFNKKTNKGTKPNMSYFFSEFQGNDCSRNQLGGGWDTRIDQTMTRSLSFPRGTGIHVKQSSTKKDTGKNKSSERLPALYIKPYGNLYFWKGWNIEHHWTRNEKDMSWLVI